MTDYIFIIYSCKKNIEKANITYDKIYDKLLNTKVYIIYGNEDLFINDINNKYQIIDDKYIILNVEDDYDHLSNKTLLLLETLNILFPSVKGVFKCDDDVIINIKHINIFLRIIPLSNIDYCGKSIIRTKEYNNFSRNNNIDKYPIFVCSYCGGPLYFLSKRAIQYFNTNEKIKSIYYEDMMVGYHLNKFNIFPDKKYDLYSDNIYDSNKISYHNSKHHEELFILLQGGLGNQLFQLACAMKIAEKYKKQFILNIASVIPNPHQNNNIGTTLNIIKQIFPNIHFCNYSSYKNFFYMYTENKNDCFLFNEEKIEECLKIYNNIVLNGYFINYKYIPTTTFEKIKITPTDKGLLNLNFTNYYFIHIRLGDYLKHTMYQINLKQYYNYCIINILKINKEAKFIICTNQYDNHLQNYLNDFPKIMKYKVQSNKNSDIDTLYIMSSCSGAICSNSTLSFMGALLQKNPKNKENIYMPYPFVNFVDGFNEHNVNTEMYPEWCSIYNTINNKVI